MTEAGAAIAGHLAAHHTLSEARLEGLIDHTAVFEIVDAPLEKIVQRQLLRCVLGRIQHAYHRSVAGTCQRLDLPDALAAVTAETVSVIGRPLVDPAALIPTGALRR